MAGRFSKMFTGQSKVFNDPIHGHIEMHPLLVKIIDTPQFQRLRNIKQLGGAYFVYPGASHNRFEHSIGVAHLAGQLAETLIKKNRTEQGNQIEQEDARDILCVQIAGLCHDLGHGPFSHLFDGPFLKKIATKKMKEGKTAEGEKLKNWKHEQGSCDMFDYLVDKNNLKEVMVEYGLKPEEDLIFIKEMILHPCDNGNDEDSSAHWKYKGRTQDKSFLYEIVSNKCNGVDVDKFDYLARDSYHLGMKTNFDHRRFISFARVCEVNGRKHICTRNKEVGNIHDLFHARHCLHRRAYQHKVNKIIEEMIAEAFLKADDHIRIEGSNGEMFTLSTAIFDMEAYTKLTDSVFDQILNSSEESLEEAKRILQDIHTRKIPQFLGELRPTGKITKWEKLIHVWKNQLAVEANLSPVDFEVLFTKMDYGMGTKDPVKHMYFYSKFKPNEAKQMTEDQATSMQTTCFSELLIRVYYKKTDDIEGYIKVQENLMRWWKPFIESWMQDEGTPAQ